MGQIQTKLIDPATVENAQPGTVIFFYDLSGRLRTKDEQGNLGYGGNDAVMVQDEYHYVESAANRLAGNPQDTDDNMRWKYEYTDGNWGRTIEVHEGGQWVVKATGQS